eukprot:TRINITY_DN29355_c0_g1_i1.p1 TRINITY_DN29355_c0_g1~~TRINITY_DN29355_c0_g1_i1.p1  ORF type:complete len:643 (+),score=55.89 TRINITY_DN29355_c0_g1_i1:56-1930(+)
MAAVAAVLSLCFGGLTDCPSGVSRQCKWVLAKGPNSPAQIAVSPDDMSVAVVAGGLHVYAVGGGETIPMPHYTTAKDVAFSSDSTKVAVALSTGGLAVVRLEGGRGRQLWLQGSQTEQGTKSLVDAVAFSQDGMRVASGNAHGEIHIRNADDGSFVTSLTRGHMYFLEALAFTHDGRIVSGGMDQRVVVWDIRSGAALKTFTDGCNVYDVKVSPDLFHFASLRRCFDNTVTIHIYKLTGSNYPLHRAIQTRSKYQMSFSHDGSKLAVVGYGDMEVYSVETGKVLQSHIMSSANTGTLSYFHTKDIIITADDKADIIMWDDVAPAVAPTVCTSIMSTWGKPDIQCGPGFHLISEEDATRCSEAICSILDGQGLGWGVAYIASTSKAFFGSKYSPRCGPFSWDGSALGASLCAPDDAHVPPTPPVPIPAVPAATVCTSIISTWGMADIECGPGYHLISEEDATRCSEAICSVLDGQGLGWGVAYIASTSKAFFGSKYSPRCGPFSWDGSALGASLCAPDDAHVPPTPPVPIPAVPAATVCTSIISTWGMADIECGPGYHLISEEDATRCSEAICSILHEQDLGWGVMKIASTNRAYFGINHPARCGLSYWSGFELGASLCAPSGAP